MNANKEILLKLIKANSAKEITELIKNNQFFIQACWWPLGDNESNFSIVSSQQSDPVNALVEKIVNSIDAILIKECLLKGIDPKDKKNAPESMKLAVEKFFGIPDADITKLDDTIRRKLAENILVVAEGSKKTPSLMIIDEGEGQLPEEFVNTFLSLPSSSGNKLNINFVQGKFNMGGTGALMFCGDRNQRYQLIVSKRNKNFNHNNLWGFTLVKETIECGRKMPMFEYLCSPNNDMFSFHEENLLIPQIKKSLSSGTFIKLYSYDLPKPSNINLDLWRDLNRRLFAPALPIMTHETRYKGESIHGDTKILVGNLFRVSREDHQWVENTFQIQSDLGEFGNRQINIVLFKDSIDQGDNSIKYFQKNEFTTDSEAIFLTVNGQTHHTLGRSILKTKANLKNIADYLMIHIDVSSLEAEANEIFHGSREQVRKNKIYRDFEDRLISDLKGNPLLQTWDEEYKKRKLLSVQPDKYFIKETAAKILSKNPLWASKLNLGKDVVVSKVSNGKPAIFKGSYIPTFLKLRGDSIKKIPINNKYSWIYFETDATNDYFTREKAGGLISIETTPQVEKSFWYRDGLISLKIITPEKSIIGDIVSIKVTLSRPNDKPLQKQLKFLFIDARKKTKSHKTHPRNPSEIKYSLPEPDYVERKRWPEFEWGPNDISKVDGSIIRINIDSNDLSDFLQRYERKYSTDSIVKTYETAIYLYTFILDNQFGDREGKDELIAKAMQGISKIVLPLNFENLLIEE